MAKAIARWVVKAAARRASGPLGLLLDAVEVIGWLDEIYPDIQSYSDALKSLDELQRLVRDPQPGYEIHHIVEKTSAAKDGFPKSMIESPENLVRIPKFKHHEITAWYNSLNENFGFITPRQYFWGASWQERYEVGLQRLRDRRVLK
ncbi:hypothetical protein [Aureimonas sp. SA4125]|uniref:hypothetical protein n=1 Tax=Aureimonas sp. SA4125 TaxID=2826993 RepID=UPI001CC670D8|nr:hypothetical protein [Aureimonas sp. SA4125]